MDRSTELSGKLGMLFSNFDDVVRPVYPCFTSQEIEDALDFMRGIRGGVVQVVDNSNIFLSGRGKNIRVDYQAVHTHLSGDCLVRASMAVTMPVDCESQSQTAFYDFLEHLGWQVHRFAPLRSAKGRLSEDEDRVDGDVRSLIRSAANLPNCDSIVVFSGDGGMTNAVKDARQAGKDVFVVAWSGTLHPALAAAATAHISVEKLCHFIARSIH